MDIRLLVCDDNHYKQNPIKDYLQEFSSVKDHHFIIDHSCNGSHILELHEKKRYHMLFLDIDSRDGLSGLDVARKIREKDEQILIVFISAYADYTHQAFKYFAFNYIIKPIDKAFFFKMMQRAISLVISRYQLRDRLSIVLNDGNYIHKILYDHILYAEKQGKRLCLKLENQTVLCPVITLTSFEQMVEPGYFVRCHKSFIVNPYKIRRIDQSELEIHGANSLIPIGRKYRQTLNKVLLNII